MAEFTAQDLKLDYFLFYQVAPQPGGQVVRLSCQFDQQPEQVQLTRLNLFGNPAQKNGQPLYDKNAHLTWYNVLDPVPDPPRVVAYENQFGANKLITGRNYALLTPTWKREAGSSFPAHLDHYRVYEVLQGEPSSATITATDQFGKQETQLYVPRFFGVPCEKYYQGDTISINNKDAHLVFYMIRPQTIEKAIYTRDQFGQRVQQLFRTVLLAAPTTKKDWKNLD